MEKYVSLWLPKPLPVSKPLYTTPNYKQFESTERLANVVLLSIMPLLAQVVKFHHQLPAKHDHTLLLSIANICNRNYFLCLRLLLMPSNEGILLHDDRLSIPALDLSSHSEFVTD